jgi:hypothetical protein
MLREDAEVNKKRKSQVPEQAGSKKKLLPGIAHDATAYFLREEAKMSTKGIVAGAAVFIALGFMADPASAWHSSLHSNVVSHANQGAMNLHINTNVVNTHMNTASHVNIGAVSTHTNIGTHASSGAINQHSSINSHTSQGASSSHSSAAATNVPAVHANESLTKGNMHNSGSQGKHSAWTAHGNTNESSHVNAAGTNTHTSIAALSRHVSVANHSNTAAANSHVSTNAHSSTAAQNQHANANSHASRAAFDGHSNLTAVNTHTNSSGHFSHGSHASW